MFDEDYAGSFQRWKLRASCRCLLSTRPVGSRAWNRMLLFNPVRHIWGMSHLRKNRERRKLFQFSASGYVGFAASMLTWMSGRFASGFWGSRFHLMVFSFFATRHSACFVLRPVIISTKCKLPLPPPSQYPATLLSSSGLSRLFSLFGILATLTSPGNVSHPS